MPPRGGIHGSREAEAYELLSREASLDKTHGPRDVMEDDNPLIHQRPRFSASESARPRAEEFAGLLGRSTGGFRQKLRRSKGWAVALELITQSTPSLMASVVGSVMTGIVFDQVQFWPAFVRIGELFILVPVLLNLKGCLEMNLASRLSTSVLQDIV